MSASAEQCLREGDLKNALSDLQQRVRSQPSEPAHRVFLFQLLVVLGQWERARTQLQVLRDLDAKSTPLVHAYRETLRCELLRAAVFAGKKSPLLFGEPRQWTAEIVQALALSAAGKAEEAQALRTRALDAAPAVGGTIAVAEPAHGDGSRRETEHRFEWLADADTRIGPMLEAVISGKYYWVPLAFVRRLRFEAPADLRDLVWTPASLVFVNGGESVAFVPTRYPGTEKRTESAFLLARRTEWLELGGGEFHGVGQRVFATDGGEYPLLDVRDVRFDAASA